MKRFHNGHALAVGVLIGLGIAGYRIWLLAATVFLAGLLVGLLAPKVAHLLEAIARRLGLEREYDYPRGWHPCESPTCRAPIPKTSRARYCSEVCRRATRMRLAQFEYGDAPPF